MQMASGLWKTMSIIVPATIANNAELVAAWLQSIVPNADYAIFVRDDGSTNDVTNATMYVATRFNGALFNYIRLYSRNFQSITTWTATYWLTVTAGDKYTVFYQ